MGDQIGIEQEQTTLQSGSKSSDVAGAPSSDTCTVCGLPLAVGEWPCVKTIRQHGRSVQTAPFSEYFDFALGRTVTSLGDRWTAMRGEIDRETGERRGQLDYREKMSPGDLSARRDRIEQQRKEHARG